MPKVFWRNHFVSNCKCFQVNKLTDTAKCYSIATTVSLIKELAIACSHFRVYSTSMKRFLSVHQMFSLSFFVRGREGTIWSLVSKVMLEKQQRSHYKNLSSWQCRVTNIRNAVNEQWTLWLNIHTHPIRSSSKWQTFVPKPNGPHRVASNWKYSSIVIVLRCFGNINCLSIH